VAQPRPFFPLHPPFPSPRGPPHLGPAGRSASQLGGPAAPLARVRAGWLPSYRCLVGAPPVSPPPQKLPPFHLLYPLDARFFLSLLQDALAARSCPCPSTSSVLARPSPVVSPPSLSSSPPCPARAWRARPRRPALARPGACGAAPARPWRPCAARPRAAVVPWRAACSPDAARLAARGQGARGTLPCARSARRDA
jgi:hypothetical protein